ncbi:MAG: hypothetical protein AAF288_01085 [Planctomycetota bacterium]
MASPNDSLNPGGGGKLLVASVVAALAAVLMVNLYVAAARERADQETITIYRLKAPVEAGSPLNRDDLEEKQVPVAYADVFEDYVVRNDRAGLEGVNAYVGAAFNRDLPGKAFLLLDHFETGSDTLVNRTPPPGREWKSVPVNKNLMPPSLRPGDEVNLRMVLGQQPYTVMEKVKVVSVGRLNLFNREVWDRGTGGVSTIEIEVTQQEAQDLLLVQNRAASGFEVTIRSAGDTRLVDVPEGGVNPRLLDRIKSG